MKYKQFRLLEQDSVGYVHTVTHLRKDCYYFLTKGIIAVYDRCSGRLLYFVRARMCLNMTYVKELDTSVVYKNLSDIRLLCIPIDRMDRLLQQDYRMLSRIIRQEHYFLKQMIWLAKLYQPGCQLSEQRAVYERLHLPFSYGMFQSLL